MAKKPNTDTAASNHSGDKAFPNLVDLLGGLRAGTVKPTEMSERELARVVEQFVFEGVGLPEIAKMMSMPDAKIESAYQFARSARAMGKGDNEKCRVAGDVWALASRGAERMRRVAREDGLKGKDRIQAEERAVTIVFDAIKLLQSLGAMPEASRFKGSTTQVQWWDRG